MKEVKLSIQEKTITHQPLMGDNYLDLLVPLTFKAGSSAQAYNYNTGYFHIPSSRLLEVSDLEKTVAESKMENSSALLKNVSWSLKDLFQWDEDEPLADGQTLLMPKFSTKNCLGPSHLLRYAAAAGKSKYVQALIQFKVIIEDYDTNCNVYCESEDHFLSFASPLMHAAYRNQSEIVKLLIVQKVDVNYAINWNSALNCAGYSLHDTSRIVFMLLASGARKADRYGNTFIYTDSHPKVIETFSAIAGAPSGAKKVKIYQEKECFTLDELIKKKLKQEKDEKSMLCPSSSAEEIAPVQWKIGTELTTLFDFLSADIIHIVCSYFIELGEDMRGLLQTEIESRIEKFIIDLKTLKKRPDDNWFSFLLKILTNPWVYRFPFLDVIYWHIELLCARTGKPLSEEDPEISEVLQKMVKQDELKKVEQAGINLYRFIQHDHIKDIVQGQSTYHYQR